METCPRSHSLGYGYRCPRYSARAIFPLLSPLYMEEGSNVCSSTLWLTCLSFFYMVQYSLAFLLLTRSWFKSSTLFYADRLDLSHCIFCTNSFGVEDIYLTNNVVPLLSVVVGLLLVFRNSSAFARWLEGRELFSNMATGVRNLARVCWVKIGSANYDPNRINSEGVKIPWQVENYGTKEKEEKIAALRMLVAMVVAAKHHVREEYESDTYEE